MIIRMVNERMSSSAYFMLGRQIIEKGLKIEVQLLFLSNYFHRKTKSKTNQNLVLDLK